MRSEIELLVSKTLLGKPHARSLNKIKNAYHVIKLSVLATPTVHLRKYCSTAEGLEHKNYGCWSFSCQL